MIANDSLVFYVKFSVLDEFCVASFNPVARNGAVGAVIRILPDRPKTIKELHLPPVVQQCSRYGKGMVLITGSTSQGKTTTMASMIDNVNEHYKKHVVTIEDPIEYVHTNKKSLIRQAKNTPIQGSGADVTKQATAFILGSLVLRVQEI